MNTCCNISFRGESRGCSEIRWNLNWPVSRPKGYRYKEKEQEEEARLGGAENDHRSHPDGDGKEERITVKELLKWDDDERPSTEEFLSPGANRHRESGSDTIGCGLLAKIENTSLTCAYSEYTRDELWEKLNRYKVEKTSESSIR